MANPSVRDLNHGGQESLLALIQAIAPDIANSSGGNLTTEEVARRLNDKLEELVGHEGLSADAEKRNERGELINEEGLPIVEISEPVDPTDLRTSVSLPTPVTVEPLLPLATLTDEARARLRAKRDRILNQLEEEEKQVEFIQRQREVEERGALSRKNKEDAVKEKERLKEARELQKKMGRTLLLNVSKAREKERQEEAAQRLRDEVADQDRKRSPTMKKKTVAFAERTEQIDRSETDPDSASSTDWGDVTPGRLTQRKRPTLLSQALLDKHPMKLNVVERMPSRQPGQSTRPGTDSDDDSEPEYPPDSSDNEEEDEPNLESDEIDFDMAQHQREIALEYYAKRNTIGKEAARALTEDDSHQLATHLPQESSEPAVSHFKANRLVSAYISEPSGSPVATVIPSSSARTIQRSIRTGKLDSEGHLVGGEDESASEDEAEGLQGMLELIRKGEIHNVGPNGECIPKHHETTQSSHQSANSSAQGFPYQIGTLPARSMRSKTPKFKASRAAAGRPSPVSLSLPVNDTPISSSATTPISYENRSSPKLGTPTTPVMTATVGERAADSSVPTIQLNSHQANPLQPALNATSREPSGLFPVIDSPSFPIHGDHAMPPMVIESPSYPQNPGRLVRPPTVLASKVVEAREPSTRPGSHNSKYSNPPSIMSVVQESGVSKTKKVSKFKAEKGS